MAAVFVASSAGARKQTPNKSPLGNQFMLWPSKVDCRPPPPKGLTHGPPARRADASRVRLRIRLRYATRQRLSPDASCRDDARLRTWALVAEAPHGHDPQAPVSGAVNVYGDVVIPMDAENLGSWRTAIFGQPTTTATTPRTHTSGGGELRRRVCGEGKDVGLGTGYRAYSATIPTDEAI